MLKKLIILSILSSNLSFGEDSFLDRYFYNNYQLEIKQYHIENGVKKIDLINNFMINSSNPIKNNNQYKDLLDEHFYLNKINYLFNLKPNKEENSFLLNYSFFFEKSISQDSLNLSYLDNIRINNNNSTILNIDKTMTIKNNDYFYDIKINKIGINNNFFDPKKCSNESCYILKENTESFLHNLKNNTNTKPINEDKTIKENNIYHHKYILHTVKLGDTLSSLSSEYNVPILLIKKLNNMKTNDLFIGKEILIKNQSTLLYKVKQSDTLYSISHKFNINPDILIKQNKLKSTQVNKGITLIIRY